MSGGLFMVIEGGGKLSAIYSDDIADLIAEGDASTARASHVEPDGKGGWTADMGPSDGPVLGPFALRQQALDAEVAWLKERMAA